MKNAVIYETGTPKKGELELINAITRRPFAAEELYVFSVTLCDNDIDRDFERFTLSALNSLAQMYVGKTGIFDHSMKGKDQVARIFSCKVETVPGTFTKDGLDYARLIARAYMPRTAKNEELITDIDAGINKEVSVGCSMGSAVCSICGTDRHIGCAHKNGRHYKKDGKKALCHTVLDNPTDAFEWSFVAVPAQPKAGVTKAFHGRELPDGSNHLSEIAKALDIECANDEEMAESIGRVKAMAALGKDHLESLKIRAASDISALWGNSSAEIFKSAIDEMDPEKLEKLCNTIHSKALEKTLPRPQTAPKREDANSGQDNYNFIV